MRRHPRKLALLAVAAALATALAACHETFRIPGESPATAELRAAELFQSVADRYTDVLFSPRFDHARLRFAETALIPSRVFDDTTVWDAASRVSPSARVLYASGELAGGRYHIDTRPSPTLAERLGDTRHMISLQLLAPSVYRWETNVDLAIGAISAADVSGALSALLRAPEGRSERELREDYRTAFPRAAAAFGRGFSVDSLRVWPGVGPAERAVTNVSVTLGFHPEGMHGAFPALADYLDKYIGPAKYHFVLADRAGVPMFDALGRDRLLTLRYRVRGGALVSLAGEPRPWPDSLELLADLKLKIRHFTVGFHNLVAAFVIDDAGHERAWTINARREPEWDLPLATEHLIRTPLRRPFMGEGALFRLSVADSAGRQTNFARRARLDVQESTILRFLGSLTAHLLGELDTKVEAEEDRFLRDGFAALRADLEAGDVGDRK